MQATQTELSPLDRAAADTNRFEAASANPTRWHAHDTGQFILVEAGTSHLYTEFGTWVVPARRVAWVPPGVRHASGSSGNGIGWVIISPVTLAEDLPSRVCVLRCSALLSSALQRIAQLQPHERIGALLWRIIAEEMRAAQPESLEVPLPSSPRLLKVARSVLTSPTAAISLNKIARQAGMSRRSFARHFRRQTGLPFARWKRAVIAQHALELVGLGHKVSSVAKDVGYESVSAFIAMFRRQYGESPRQFLLRVSCFAAFNGCGGIRQGPPH
jgi:AraC-like DNA-binding protein/quercetin dioxygenase-like cupin family protein